MSNTYVKDEKTIRENMRRPLLLYKILTDYTYK